MYNFRAKQLIGATVADMARFQEEAKAAHGGQDLNMQEAKAKIDLLSSLAIWEICEVGRQGESRGVARLAVPQNWGQPTKVRSFGQGTGQGFVESAWMVEFDQTSVWFKHPATNRYVWPGGPYQGWTENTLGQTPSKQLSVAEFLGESSTFGLVHEDKILIVGEEDAARMFG